MGEEGGGIWVVEGGGIWVVEGGGEERKEEMGGEGRREEKGGKEEEKEMGGGEKGEEVGMWGEEMGRYIGEGRRGGYVRRRGDRWGEERRERRWVCEGRRGDG